MSQVRILYGPFYFLINIFSGKFKNFFLRFSKKLPNYFKPTINFIRKKVFSWIGSFSNLNCIDVFAGSGSLGLEAISRGCKSCVFLEKNKKIFYLLKKNISNLSSKNIKLFNCDFFHFINNFNFSFYDIIFFDSPYLNLKNLINFINLSFNNLKFNSKIYVESIFDIGVLLKYFLKKVKILNYESFKKINFFLFEVT